VLDRDDRPTVVDVDALIAKARAIRQIPDSQVSIRQLDRWKRAGRQ
jgi:hypothetical protein